MSEDITTKLQQLLDESKAARAVIDEWYEDERAALTELYDADHAMLREEHRRRMAQLDETCKSLLHLPSSWRLEKEKQIETDILAGICRLEALHDDAFSSLSRQRDARRTVLDGMFDDKIRALGNEVPV